MNILLLTYQGDLAGSTYSISFLAKGLSAKGHTVVVGCRKGVTFIRTLTRYCGCLRTHDI
ncbi:MAG: glycosyltransferase family 4 protein [Saprospiraceae bacterium]|nr:glycosyltransferase family 4 protein [Saprospiraceae bacterium]